LAFALEASARADPEALAVHFHSAGEAAKAARYAVVAADRAAEALAFETATHFYRLALAQPSAATAENHTLRVKLGDALSNAGHGAEAAEVYLTATDQTSPHERLELHRRAATQFLVSGHMAEGLTVLRTVLHTLGMSLPATPRRALLSLLVRRVQIRLRGLRFRTREASQIPAAALVRLDTCWSVAQSLAMVDNVQAAAFQARHLLLALRAGDPYRVSRALAVEAGYYAMAGGHQRHRRDQVLQVAMALADRLQHPHAQGLTTLVRGMAAFLEGHWPAARQWLERADTMLRERCIGVAWECATARLMGCVALFFMGEVQTLCQRLPQLLEAAEARGDRYEATDLRLRIAHVQCLADDTPDQARQHVAQALQQWPSDAYYLQHWWSLIARVEIALYAGQGREAYELITRQWPAVRRAQLLRVQYIRIESWYHRAQGALAVAAEPDIAIADRTALAHAAERDARRIAREGTPWGTPLAHLIRAGAAAARGQVDEAVAWLSAAEAGLEAAGMLLYGAAARRRRGQLLDGDHGHALIATADAWITRQQIAHPSRMTAMLAPGPWARP
jgi:hypothetical protein